MAIKKILSICLLLISLLTSCNKSNPGSTTLVASKLPQANIKFSCPQIEASTANLNSSGALILHGAGKTYSMDMASMAMTPINKPNEALLEFSVSPNQGW